ncbi:hypothetical protein COLO4_21896 [Corchorus olitorius]|uniref:Uncharacterized protein n=1 Tax=Corchorus olitorius TaxID=93759 RepID=A0A1R3IQ31_9ROSI|nr:hypothetical protein COLO4_21896 [Corchorus olitorius]
MAREFVVIGGNGPGEGVAGFVTHGGLLLLCMIVFSLSIISMVIFACGNDGNSVPVWCTVWGRLDRSVAQMTYQTLF